MKKPAVLTRAGYAAAVALVLGGLVAGTGTASAGTASAALSCSPSGCGDPIRTGCNSQAYIVMQESFMGGLVNMWWSPTCAVNWIQYDVPNDNYANNFRADIIGSSGEDAVVSSLQPGWEYSDVVLSPGAATMCVVALPYPSGVVTQHQCWTQDS